MGIVLQTWCVLLLSAAAQAKDVDPGIIAESKFYVADKPDGWHLEGESVQFKEAPGRFVHALSAFSRGPKAWDFCAPKKFLGNVVRAYGGVLRFQFGFATHTGKELDHAALWGIRLRSESAGLELGAHVRFGDNEIPLLEEKWTVLKGSGKGHNPTHSQILLTLTKLSGLYIRGSYYTDSQLSWIDEVQLTVGNHNVDHLHKRVKNHLHKHVKSNTREKVGVGMVLGYTTADVRGSEKRMLTVKRIVDGGPAQTSAVIEAGDFVLEVDGVGMAEMTMQTAAEHISGDSGTTLSLAMMKPSGVRYFETLTRAAIDPELASEALDRKAKAERLRRQEERERMRAEAARRAEEEAQRRKEEELRAEQERQRIEEERIRREEEEAERKRIQEAEETEKKRKEAEELKKERDRLQREQRQRDKDAATRRALEAERRRQEEEQQGEAEKAAAEKLAEKEQRERGKDAAGTLTAHRQDAGERGEGGQVGKKGEERTAEEARGVEEDRNEL